MKLLATLGLMVALLAMSLSIQQPVHAEDGSSKQYICSTCGNIWDGVEPPNSDAHDNVFTIDFGQGAAGGIVEVHNRDLSQVVEKVDSTPDRLDDQDTSVFDGPNANPKLITLGDNGSATLVAVSRSSGLRDGRAAPNDDGVLVAAPNGGDDDRYQVKAFHGNRIQITHIGHHIRGFPHTEIVSVDNVQPALDVTSPARPLIVQDGVNITFSADFTDTGSGFPDDAAAFNDDALTGTPGIIDSQAGNHETHKGGVHLVVAGNVVALDERHFTKIAGGWRVAVTIGSTAIQNVAAHAPWYFEVADRANNSRRMSGSITGRASGGGTDRSVVIHAFRGALNANTFLGNEIRITQNGVTSNARPIARFNGAGGTVQVDTPFFADDPDTSVNECPGGTAAGCVIGADARYEILRASLITVDSEKPVAVSATTGTAYDSAAGRELTGPDGTALATSMKIALSDAARSGGTVPGSGLDPASVTTSAFSISHKTVVSALVNGNNIYLTLREPLDPAEKPVVAIAGNRVRDKAGNVAVGKQLTAADGLGPNLSFSVSNDLNAGAVKLTIRSDEQLGARPRLWVTPVAEDGSAPYGGGAAIAPASIRQTSDRGYSYTHPAGRGRFSVYVEGVDTFGNRGAGGDRRTSRSASAFTFEVDTTLNNDVPPIVSILDHENVAEETEPIEQAHTMIIRVDFSQEGKEYHGDAYHTVRLTSVSVDVTPANGKTKTRTFDIAEEVNSGDNVKHAFAIVHPEVGKYTLTLRAADMAGNKKIAGEEKISVSWEVAPLEPVEIPLAPGWNLISLPFMPPNPAINAVVPADHPADIVTTFDSRHRIWLVSRRDPQTGLFAGDVQTITPSTGYFMWTHSFQPLRLIRPPLSTHDDPPAPPVDLLVTKGWNLVPVVSPDFHVPYGIAADRYFRTLGSKGHPGWVKALTFDTLVRTWRVVRLGENVAVRVGGPNPCTGKPVVKKNVEAGKEPCQNGRYTERSPYGSLAHGDVDGEFDGRDSVTLHSALKVGKGYWIYSNVDGVIIP